jgi:hypothetical protein
MVGAIQHIVLAYNLTQALMANAGRFPAGRSAAARLARGMLNAYETDSVYGWDHPGSQADVWNNELGIQCALAGMSLDGCINRAVRSCAVATYENRVARFEGRNCGVVK